MRGKKITGAAGGKKRTLKMDKVAYWGDLLCSRNMMSHPYLRSALLMGGDGGDYLSSKGRSNPRIRRKSSADQSLTGPKGKILVVIITRSVAHAGRQVGNWG